MSTENTETGGTVPGSENGVGLGAGEPNTFEPEEGTETKDTPARGETSVATAEDTPDVEETPVETTEPS